MQNYAEAVEFLFSRHSLGIKPGLETIRLLLERLGNPQEKFKSVLIAGTNGKGSTAATLHSLLAESGYRAGLYTSPHLLDFRERVRINREMISEEEALRGLEILREKAAGLDPTFFEYMTALAFLHFAQQGVEMAVVEVGLGGRWDATNILRPELSLITSIALDHANFLGTTLQQVAREKVEIVKEGGTLLTYSQEEEVLEIFKNFCEERGAEFWEISQDFDAQVLSMNLTGSVFDLSFNNNRIDGIKIPLAGSHQVKNATLALAAAIKLRERGFSGITGESLREGAEKTHWPGRLQTVSVAPKVVLDGAHNPDAARVLVHELQELFEFSRLVWVVGILRDKDVSLIINELAKIPGEILAVELPSDRAEDPETLTKLFQERGRTARAIPRIGEALEEAKRRAGRDGLVCVTGSLFTVAAALKALEIRV